jgi:hypothetical protein
MKLAAPSGPVYPWFQGPRGACLLIMSGNLPGGTAAAQNELCLHAKMFIAFGEDAFRG